jgi:hypothetical protein
MNPSLTTAAAEWGSGYIRCGWRVFPVKPHEKSPVYNGWQKDATLDPEMVRRYFPAGLDRNIGVVCGEAFDAWDIEVQHLVAFGALWGKNLLPETPIAQTGRGGLHILTQPTGIGHTRKLYLDGTHIGELKSAGGFILVCPSVTESQYLWRWAPDQMALAPAPTWLLDLVQAPKKPRSAPAWQQGSISPATDILPLVGAVRKSHEGDRNAVLHWAANRACDDGISQDFAARELMTAFIEISRQDESRYEREHEARATIASAYHR